MTRTVITLTDPLLFILFSYVGRFRIIFRPFFFEQVRVLLEEVLVFGQSRHMCESFVNWRLVGRSKLSACDQMIF